MAANIPKGDERDAALNLLRHESAAGLRRPASRHRRWLQPVTPARAASISSSAGARCGVQGVPIANVIASPAIAVTTEAMLAEVPKEKPAAPALPGGGGMGGMDF